MKPTNVVSIASGAHRAKVLARRDALVLEHLKLAESIARSVGRRLPPSFDDDDLIATANLALIRAATRYRPAAHDGTPFSAYARFVVRGAVIESIRRKRWTENTRDGIEQLNPRRFDPDEVMGEHCVRESGALQRMATPEAAPAAIDRKREDRRLIEACSWLPAIQQKVIAQYYSPQELTFAEVGNRLHLTRRQTQAQHASAIVALRKRLKQGAA